MLDAFRLIGAGRAEFVTEVVQHAVQGRNPLSFRIKQCRLRRVFLRERGHLVDSPVMLSAASDDATIGGSLTRPRGKWRSHEPLL